MIITLIRNMIGKISGMMALRRSAERARRLVSLLCALVFLMAGIAHIDHMAPATSAAASIAATDAGDGGSDAGTADRSLIKTCHYCSLPALPSALVQIDLAPCASVLPPGAVAFLNARNPGAELPPPKLST